MSNLAGGVREFFAGRSMLKWSAGASVMAAASGGKALHAMYLGHSDYRIHGTNDPTTIGKFVSSGCIRLTNPDVEDLFNRVKLGAKVIVLPKGGSPQFEAKRAMPSQASLTSRPERAGQPMQLSRLN
jgi:hypothetical protein